jgi:hypothetical protein
MGMDAKEFKQKIAAIYEIAYELGNVFEIDKCTPDGHLLGTIGQIAAKIGFRLKFGSEEEGNNCTWSDGAKKINVQVVCSGRGNIALRRKPEHLIALEIASNGSIRLLFNGPGKLVWERIQHQRSAQKYASANLLRMAQTEVTQSEQLPVIENLFDP